MTNTQSYEELVTIMRAKKFINSDVYIRKHNGIEVNLTTNCLGTFTEHLSHHIQITYDKSMLNFFSYVCTHRWKLIKKFRCEA